MDKGILYVATGLTYVNEAIIAATSCKKHNNYPIALITDNDGYNLPAGLFDHIIIKPARFSYRDKLLLKYSPFEQTIFLDTDTYVAEPLDDLFSILAYRELAIHQADEGYEFKMPGFSNAMPEFNTGVLAYKLTPAVKQLFNDWDAQFDATPHITTDQYHLRKTLYSSDVRFAVFSSAYNFIIYYPNFVIQSVKIVHGRPAELLPAIAADMNRIRHENSWRRMFFPYSNDFALIYQNLKNEDIYKLLRFHSRAMLGNWYRGIKKMFKGNKKEPLT